MNTISRRQFLQLTSIAIAGSTVNRLPFFQPSALHSGFQGRALSAVPVYSAPRTGMIVGTLWPDSIVPIMGIEQDWYRVPTGYVQREQMQPMKPYLPQQPIQLPNVPFWAEVSAPVAPVRQACAADSPLVTRIGHGGVARIVDFLPGEPNGWYGVGDENDGLIGWSQALYWQPVESTAAEPGDHDLRIDGANQRVTAWENGDLILQVPFSAGQSLNPGSYSVTEQKPTSARLQIEGFGKALYGVPWVTRFGDHELTGVYWHNRFGKASPGPAIQVTPPLAEWLYGWLNERSQIRIV